MNFEVKNNRIYMNGEEVGVTELNKQKKIMQILNCNKHYQALKTPSLRIYAALLDTILVKRGGTAQTYASTLIY